MIKKKTVFVLGAGASMPYGFPSGAELRNEICESAYADTPMRATLATECGINKQIFKEFAEAFLRSSLPSIDAFLAKRSEYAEVGKLAIAQALCRRESPASPFRTDNDDHWYMALWTALQPQTADAAALRFNSVRFVTFNYDRSLEFFLHEATKNTFNLSDDKALEAWSRLPILHIYGALGEFHPVPSESARPYTKKVDGAALRLAASALRVIPEAREDDANFQMARNWFEWAERICFLGFGFDALNMERLGLADVLNWKIERQAVPPWIVASMFGKTDKEIDTITAAHFPSAAYETKKERNLMTLRHTGVLD